MKNLAHKEGKFTKAIENQVAKASPNFYLIGAISAIGISLILKLMGKKDNAQFVGQWVAPILLLGVYDKLAEQSDND